MVLKPTPLAMHHSARQSPLFWPALVLIVLSGAKQYKLGVGFSRSAPTASPCAQRPPRVSIAHVGSERKAGRIARELSRYGSLRLRIGRPALRHQKVPVSADGAQ